MTRLGTPIGLWRRATIRKYNTDGTVTVALDEAGLAQDKSEYKCTFPLAWSGNEGEFLGGYPKVGSSVSIVQGHGGQWTIIGYVPSDNVLLNTNTAYSGSFDNNKLSALKPNRIVGQVKSGNRFFLDPKIGFQVGSSKNYLHVNPNENILSFNLNSKFEITQAGRSISNLIKRDIFENQNRFNFELDSHNYEKTLYTIGLDPTIITNNINSNFHVRNPALVENHEIIYEFAHDSYVENDFIESNKYSDNTNPLSNNKKELRTDILGLTLEYPNHLIETVKGTVVDSFGNILDLNRSVLPIGKLPTISLKQSQDKIEAYKNIRQQLRKSIAYHFELNARKADDDFLSLIPDPNNNTDYKRNQSRFFIDLDKEGQVKLNIPASSETGNLALFSRYENFSVLKSKEDDSIGPNQFIKSVNSQDIFLDQFGSGSIKLSGSNSDLDGYEAPLDRITDEPFKYGTVYHNIVKTCNEFQASAAYLQAGMKLVNFDKKNRLNNDWKPLSKVVSDTIIVNGENANGGGRSATINADGMISLNVGANTIDRQSMWIDTAGGIVSNIGRDLRGISYAGNYDGDVFIQVGGTGIKSSNDSRFKNENDAYRNGTVDIRVQVNGQNMIFRMSSEGISIISPGTITMSAQQDIILRSNGNVLLEGEQIVMYAESTKRTINRLPANTIG